MLTLAPSEIIDVHACKRKKIRKIATGLGPAWRQTLDVTPGDAGTRSRHAIAAALPQWYDLKAAYRFFDNAKAVPEHILAGQIDATWSRCRSVSIVLAVQDTTYLNWAHHPTT